MKEENEKEIISVSQYLDRLNTTLKVEKAKISGEVCDLKMYDERSYLYFSIKDSKDQSMLKCFMWKRDFRISGVDLRDGIEVIITAYPNIYKPNGGLTMQVELLELVGEGALQIAYEKLKKKLELDGLFAIDRKRELPSYPHRIGVITSRSGAVINDFLGNLSKFGFEILFVDSKVEGQEATKDLLRALQTLKNKNLDVLVVMRGGGSLESFQSFNNEILVREVANFPTPVLTGIGHDKDVPLMSLVSDKNVSTPTAVANLLNLSWSNATSIVRLSEQKINSRFSERLKDLRFIIENSQVSMEKRFVNLFDKFRRAEEILFRSLGRIDSGIKRVSDLILNQSKGLVRGLTLHISNVENILRSSQKSIELSNPKRQLSFGYSIVRSNGKILRRVNDTKKGDKLDITLSDGTIKTQTI